MHCISIKYGMKALCVVVMSIYSMASFHATALEREAGCLPRVALLGDSMTWIGGDSCQNPQGWSHYLKRSGLCGEIDMYARSGATWCNTSATKADTESYTEILDADNVVYNQVLRLIKSADSDSARTPEIIIIMAGANDAWFRDRRPGIFEDNQRIIYENGKVTSPSNVISLYGSVMLSVNNLKERFPTSKIVLVTPTEMSRTPAEIISKVSDIIEVAGKACGVLTFRADKDVSIRHDEEKKNPHYTSDGVHTNSEGARMLGEYIIGNLEL